MDKIIRNDMKRRSRHPFLKAFFITLGCFLLVLVGYFASEVVSGLI